jgi:Cu(I)/Ag(I) efflux system membrane fusion protein
MKKFIVISIFSATAILCASTVQAEQKQVAAQQSSATHSMLKVKGNCETCKSRIEKAALSVKGVRSASWDARTGTLHLDYDSKVTNLNVISKAIAKVGHDTQLDKADLKTYNSLPGCCKYQR